MIQVNQVNFLAIPPRDSSDVTEFIRFECQVDGCGDIVLGRRLDVHAKEAHRARMVSVDIDMFWNREELAIAPRHEDSVIHHPSVYGG